MHKKVFLLFIIVVISFAAVPLFAGVSLDIGVSALGNSVHIANRPAGGYVALGMTLFDYKAIVQVTGGFFVPPLGENYDDPAGVLSAGVLVSPIQYLYLGMRTGMMTPPDEYTDWLTYGSLVLRVQNPGKGIHYFAETEISMLGTFNRFSTGVNFTL